MIRFKCACGKEYKLDDKFGGRKAKCKSCGETIVVPNTGEAKEVEQPSELEPVQVRQEPLPQVQVSRVVEPAVVAANSVPINMVPASPFSANAGQVMAQPAPLKPLRMKRQSDSVGSCLVQLIGLGCILAGTLMALTIVAPLVLIPLGLFICLKGGRSARWLSCPACGSRLASGSIKICPACHTALRRPLSILLILLALILMLAMAFGAFTVIGSMI